MRVTKVFNNNAVLARDGTGRQMIVTGRGVGFQAKPGQRVDSAKVTCTFVPADEPVPLAQVVSTIPPEHVALADEALDIARSEMGEAITAGVVVGLADHLSCAIKRAQRGIELSYPLRAEGAHLYPRELALAERMVAFLNARLEIPVPSAEAVAMAMHLVNVGFTTGDLSSAFRMTRLLRQIFQVLSSSYGREFDTESVSTARFITHMRYFFVRAAALNQFDDDTGGLGEALRASHPEAYQCAVKVRALLELRLGQPISDSELNYLTIHISRLASET